MPTNSVRPAVRGSDSNIVWVSQVAKQLITHALGGAEPDISSADLAAAERGSAELAATAIFARQPQSKGCFPWGHQADDVAAFVALYSLALRRSRPFREGDGTAPTYTRIREYLSIQLVTISGNEELWQQLRCERLSSALLATDILEMYSRLFAEAAQALQPSASPSGVDWSEAAENAPMGAQQPGGQRQQPRGPDHEAQRRGTRPQQPDPKEVKRLLDELLRVCGCFTQPMFEFYEATENRSAASSSRSDDGGAITVGGSSGGSGRGGSTAPAEHPTQAVIARLHSSWVLEHWARLLLLTTPAALSGGSTDASSSQQQCEALALHATRLDLLWRTHHMVGFSWSDFLRRPCGCTLAATHMAHLCAALDGGSTFGLAKPTTLILPQLKPDQLLRTSHTAATQHDEAAVQRGAAADLHPATATLEAWVMLLGESLPEQPGGPGAADGRTMRDPAVAVTPVGAEAGPSAPQAGSGDGMGTGQGDSGVAVKGGGDSGGEAPGATSNPCSSLPPLNRAATFNLCLRLAKGVLAHWGEAIPGVGLAVDGESGVHSAGRCVLPKISSALVLHHAMACARLALLPGVWGRERVRGPSRAQLRSWWDTYVAAVQHPEALLVGRSKRLRYPTWTSGSAGISAAPSADASAALEAGRLPCLTRMVTRMGAGHGGGAVWVPHDSLPGVAPCWSEAMLLGPMGQLSDFLSALGRRLRLAVEELRAVAAGSGGSGHSGGGRSVGWLAAVAHEVMRLAHICLGDLFVRVVDGDLPAGVGLERSGRMESGAGGETGAGAPGPGGVVMGSGAEEGLGAEAAAAAAHATAPLAAPRLAAVRSSLAIAELLPALSHCLTVCAELRRAGAAWRSTIEDGTADELNTLLDHCRALSRAVALPCTSLLLARCMLAAGQQGNGCDCNGGSDAGGGGNDGGGSCSSDGGAGGVGGGRVATPWCEFLLRDVRLMEMLGAAMELRVEAAGAAATAPPNAIMASPLARALLMAATAFPGAFRAAVGSGGAATTAASAESVGLAGTGESMGTAGRTAGAAGSYGPRGGRRLISLQAVRSLLLSQDRGVELSYLAYVLGGCEPTPEMRQGFARQYIAVIGERPEGSVEAVLRALLPPSEARRAAAAAAQGSG